MSRICFEELDLYINYNNIFKHMDEGIREGFPDTEIFAVY